MGRAHILRLLAWPYAALTAAVLVLWLLEVQHPVTVLFDLATFWWTLPAVALVLVASLRRDRTAAALFALPAGLWLWAYGGAFLPTTAPDVAADLRVVTYNTFVGAPDERHVLELVATTEPDVLLLQEVFAPREEALLIALGDRYPHQQIDRSPGVGAVAVYSRHPITDVVPVVDASERSRGTSVVRLDVDGRPLQVTSLHLISPCPACGPSVLERLELEDDVRRAEIGSVLDRLDPDIPAVVGGDLNSSDRSTAYRQLVAAGFTDPQRDVGSGMGFTWPADGRLLPPVVRIDWLLARDLVAVAASVEEARGSDHRAVVVDLAFDDDPR
ncbi:endonuclease/exonuclease/phosphatase family protein [Nitriliruptor alkaliphilus]|uniref:endonuclease/exonuclease/phosphatase family protein n=1 Tax=Nitriliruptor alkaliphilus TaxID=427918 RepID=UPI0006968257|nr:endonuclease/exonuclease/phosphatase family protein [Nitriliruptor alkaliphilus]